ncbi:MAG: hypothetical protein K6G84_10265 [Lachnospiraceae bacterium]|nr:hypothetical protein [Lachnospiraceae bacterium]
MLNFSVGSLVFAIIIILMPILMRLSWKMRPYVFLVVNTAVFVCTFNKIYAFVVAAAWILIPYFAAPLLVSTDEKGNKYFRMIFYAAMLTAFLYMMHYDWIVIFQKIPYYKALKFLGLSYFLFREIDYTMQYGYLKETHVKLSFVDYFNYVTSFYTIMAGPILRYEEFVTDFYDETKPELSADEILSQLHRIVFGYIKLYVISSFMSFMSGYWFGRITEAGNIFKAVIIYLIFAAFNAGFIYFNFVGYCDVVTGAARLAGMTLRENFNKPYMARSMVEFWNRHHITLSEWIRDYIYSPIIKALLSGAFKKKLFQAQCCALFMTFLIAGIWHGTNFNYVVYGLLEGLGVVISSVRTQKLKKKYGKKGLKEYENRKGVIIFEHCWTLMYVAVSFSFVGYDVVGLLTGVVK